MLIFCGADKRFAGFILLECAPVQAECIALFAASSAENRLKYLDGFRGAAFLASTCGRFALEYVIWETPAAIAAARANPVFLEHISIVEHHATVRLVSFSSFCETFGITRITFERGGRFAMAVYRPQAPKPWPQMLGDLRSSADCTKRTCLVQMAEDGTSVVLLSGDEPDSSATSLASSTLGKPDFQDVFTVVEGVSSPKPGEKLPAPYSLALSARQA